MIPDALWQAFLTTRASAVREQLILHYLPLVHHVARNLVAAAHAVLTTDDLVGFGLVGLIEAIDRFEPAHAASFETFARPRIRGSIIDAYRRLDLVPRSTRQRVRTIEAAQAVLQQALGREPDSAEVADQVGLSRERVNQALHDGRCTLVSLDRSLAPVGSDEGLALSDTLADERALPPPVALERQERHAALRQALAGLAERERLILQLRYHEELTWREIGAILQVTESRVCQLHGRALAKLRLSLMPATPTQAAA